MDNMVIFCQNCMKLTPLTKDKLYGNCKTDVYHVFERK